MGVKAEILRTARVNTPNFFILGAAKSGTTSLYHYLSQHPEVFMSNIKEPSFFCETFQIVKTAVAYFELFDSVSDEKVIGEASHVYLSDPKSSRLLRQFFPNAKFLVCLRNPVERAYALYKDMYNHRWETLPTFRRALEVEEIRLHSEEFKWNNPQYFYNFLYFHSGLYGAQLQRYYTQFDKTQFHVIKLEDLELRFHDTITSIFEFLEVTPDFLPEAKVYNKTNYIVRAPKIRDFILKWLPESRLTRTAVDHTYKKAKPLDPSIKKELMCRYEEDQALLQSLCGIRFS